LRHALGRPGLELIDLPFGGQMTQIELDRRERSGVTDDPKI
jgi:glyoxylate carboligase